MTLFGYRIPMMAALLVWCVAWEIVGRLELLLLFPPLSRVIVAMGDVVTSRSFAEAAWITLYSYAWGMALAIVCGIAVGVLMGRVRAADRLLKMWVNMFLSAPLSALVPMIKILLDIGTTTVIATVFMFAVWIIALDTRAGVMNVARSLVEMAASVGASRWQTTNRILLLTAMSEILACVRLGFIRGVMGVVIGQLLVSIIGVGALFTVSSNNFLMEHFWALTLMLFVFALTVGEILARIEARIDYYAGERS